MKLTAWLATTTVDLNTLIAILAFVLSAGGGAWAVRDTIRTQTREITDLKSAVTSLNGETAALTRNVRELSLTLKLKGVIPQ